MTTRTATELITVTSTRRRRTQGRYGWMLSALTWIVALLTVFPFIWMIITAFKSEVDAVTLPPKLFFEPTLEQFQTAFANNFLPFFQNSITSSVVSVVLVMVLALPAAYALSIRPIRAWRDVMFFLLSTRMLPIAGAIIPIYLISNWLGLLDQTVLLIIMYTAMNLPLAVWLIRSFMVEIPKEILEAARVDGANFYQELWRIVWPMVAPGLAATALLCFIFSWNEFFLARSLTSVQAQTVPLYLVGFISTQGLFLAKLSAASLLATLPVVLAGLLAQKQLVRGLSLGAIK
ncbi:carbohydrate ABC transporter permease [Microbacterium sp. ET2]|uniref:carbohydrate ABC transporter permease n=1 Tax=Microbacterium albipurpureum TaxID=3050384 RepID=UPI00259C7787|nr:carbohydrate ABC transporter permease [Microbacterium sp. ET2 (Ac-2212)]WJL97001.1 carbohydrate ABC transporter permease [Microbacterium sp. ET2 (Ac-2212)]